MKRIILLSLYLFAVLAAKAQDKVYTFSNPEIIPVKMERLSKPVREVPEAPVNLKGTVTEHENESIERHMPIVNNHALPAGADQALQQVYTRADSRSPNSVSVNIITTLQGLSASVSPSDNNIAVGPNHVVQMANNNVSTNLRIWDKAGNVLINNITVQSFSGINDYGDPNILYDQ